MEVKRIMHIEIRAHERDEACILQEGSGIHIVSSINIGHGYLSGICLRMLTNASQKFLQSEKQFTTILKYWIFEY